MTASVYAGASAPEAIAVTITAGTSGVDMTTVTAVTLRVRKENSETSEWTTTISGQTTGSLVATHVFAAADVATPGNLRVMPVCTMPSGVRRCAPFALNVLA